MPSRNTKSSLGAFQIIPGGLAQNNSLYEQRIEARLLTLLCVVDRFVESQPAASLSEQGNTREALEKLVVTQSTLQWIVGVAKHCETGIRRRLWAAIEESLARFEKTLELSPRLHQIARPAPQKPAYLGAIGKLPIHSGGPR